MGERHEGGFIPGVFNYCDRWCERCPFSSRCRVYAMEMGIAVHGLEKELDDVEDELRPDPEAEGPDAGGPVEWEFEEPSEAEVEQEMLQRDAARLLSEAHPLAEDAKAFAGLAGQLVEAAADRTAAAGADAGAMQDALEVLSRYRFFIPAKLHRALMGRDRNAMLDLDEDEEDIPSDADGSAKIAHITCAAAREAAGRVGSLVPALAPLAGACAETAERVLRGIDQTFPGHGAFRRPGFDDPPQDGGQR